MFRWIGRMFSRRNSRPGDLYPESLWVVELDDHGISATDQSGQRATILKSDLKSVAVATNDGGPWSADVWWLLYGPDGKLAIAFPQGATGEAAAIDYLIALPGFDQEKLIEAMACTEDAAFPLWQRTAA